MNRIKYDVVIVGAGPAGSTAAYLLAGSGMRVALVDKHAFPRDKLCGGLLTCRTKKVFEQVYSETWDSVIEISRDGAAFYYKNSFLNSVDNCHPLFFTSRRSFDVFLLELAEKQGADIMLGTPASSVVESENAVVFKGGEVIKGDFIIGADGVTSRVAHSIFPGSFDLTKLALGFETEIPIDSVRQKVDKPEIFFGILKWGYAWIFPKAESLTVGVGGLWRFNKDMRNILVRFIKDRFGLSPTTKIGAHYIPFGNYMETPGRNNILLAGDAAGLVEPITGEGIAFAIQSGKYAAESILEAASLKNPLLAYGLYANRYNEITNMLDDSNRVKYIIFSEMTERLFAGVLKRSTSVIRKYMDILAGDSDYKEYRRMILKKGPRVIFRKFMGMLYEGV